MGREIAARVDHLMGTVASIQVRRGRQSEEEVEVLLDEACALLHDIDEAFSTWKPESPMSRLRDGRARLGELPVEIPLVLYLCEQAKQLSHGWFDPWALEGGVDPSGLVKGWAAGEALALIRTSGAAAAMVNVGGDIGVFGRAPDGGRWRVGIRHPWRPDALACVIECESAVATSGRYERGEHLVNPFGAARPSAASATVTGPDLAFADALATALAVAGEEGLEFVAEADGYEGYVIGEDGREATTPGFDEVVVRANSA